MHNDLLFEGSIVWFCGKGVKGKCLDGGGGGGGGDGGGSEGRLEAEIAVVN